MLRTLEPELAGLPPLPLMSAAPPAGTASRMSLGADPDPFGPSGLDGRPSRGTVLRYRDRRGGPDELSAAASERASFGLPGAAAAFTGHRPERPPLRSRPVVLALAAAVAVLAVVAGLVIARLPSRPAAAPRPGPTASHPQPTAAYTFPSQQYGSGLVVTRRWTLSGKDGTVLTETITLSSATGKTLTTWFKDSIPAAITNSMQALRFRVIPGKIVNSDPVVEWYVRVPAHGTVTLGYVAAVSPQGATTARLAGWAQRLDATEKRLNTPPAPRSTPSAAAPAFPAASPTEASSGGTGTGTGTRTPTRPTAVIPAWSPATRTRPHPRLRGCPASEGGTQTVQKMNIARLKFPPRPPGSHGSPASTPTQCLWWSPSRRSRWPASCAGCSRSCGRSWAMAAGHGFGPGAVQVTPGDARGARVEARQAITALPASRPAGWRRIWRTGPVAAGQAAGPV